VALEGVGCVAREGVARQHASNGALNSSLAANLFFSYRASDLPPLFPPISLYSLPAPDVLYPLSFPYFLRTGSLIYALFVLTDFPKRR